MDYVDFGEVVRALKRGKRAARREWIYKGVFIFRQVPAQIPNQVIPKMTSLPDSVKHFFEGKGSEIQYEDQIAIVSWLSPRPEGDHRVIRGWSPSVEDILAEDWVIEPQR